MHDILHVRVSYRGQGCQVAWVRNPNKPISSQKKPKKSKKTEKSQKEPKKHKHNLVVKNLEHIIIAVKCQSDVHYG